MGFRETSTAEAYAIRKLRKKDREPMSGMDAEQTNPVVRLAVDAYGNRLDTWKEIAVYLGRVVRTAQRWQKTEGLPVHRHFHAKASTVYAFKYEVDAWLQRRQPVAGETASRKEYSEHGDGWLNSKLGATRMQPKSGLWLENAGAGVGSGNCSFVGTWVQTLVSFCRSRVCGRAEEGNS